MRLIDWLLALLDAPRYCPDDGHPIEVEDLGGFDGETGQPVSHWVWHCPGVHMSRDGERTEARQTGVHTIHAHGYGRPRWFDSEAPTDE